MVKLKPKLNTLYKISDQISLIGTSHLEKTSVKKVTALIQRLHPHVVMIELDAEEYQSLIDEHSQPKTKKNQNRKSVEETDFLGFIYNNQQAFGDLIHIKPGSELFGAVNAAMVLGIKVEFIDLPFRITEQRIREVQAKIQQEQAEIIKEFRQQSFAKKELKSFLSELHKAEVIDQLVLELKRQYPELYQVLFVERNAYMVDRVWQYQIDNPDDQLLIIVGGAHMQDLISLLQQKNTGSK